MRLTNASSCLLFALCFVATTPKSASVSAARPSHHKSADSTQHGIDCKSVLARGLPSDAVVVPTKTTPPFQMAVHKSNDLVSQDIQATGVWDDMATFFDKAATTVDSCRGCVGRRHFVDIGANLGSFSLTAAAQNYSVVSFEPFERNLALFRYSVCINGFEDRVHIIPVALSDQKATCKLVAFPANLGDGIVQCGSESASNATVVIQTVHTKRLDDFAGILPDCGVMKIDVEGFEPKVLLGGSKLMTSPRAPLRIKTEMNVPLLQHNAYNTTGFYWQFHFLGYRPLHTTGATFRFAEGEASPSIFPPSLYTHDQGELFDVQFVPAAWNAQASRLAPVCG